MPREYQQHDRLHGFVARPLQGFLAMALQHYSIAVSSGRLSKTYRFYSWIYWWISS
jgi:hypothetical protein